MSRRSQNPEEPPFLSSPTVKPTAVAFGSVKVGLVGGRKEGGGHLVRSAPQDHRDHLAVQLDSSQGVSPILFPSLIEVFMQIPLSSSRKGRGGEGTSRGRPNL